MLQGDLDCIPIEVKAEQNLRAKSLKAFCDKYQPDMAVRSSMVNYKKEDWLINVPLYMLAEYLKSMVYVIRLWEKQAIVWWPVFYSNRLRYSYSVAWEEKENSIIDVR